MRRRHCCAPGDHVHDLEVIRGRCARRGGQSAPESSIPCPPPLPLRGQRAPHLLRFRSRDDQVFMPSMLCRPRRAAGTQGTLGGASRHSRRRRPSAPSASPARCAPGAGNPAGRQGELRGSRDSRGTGEIEPWGSWGSGAAGGVRSVVRGAPCPLRPRLPAAGTQGRCWGGLEGQSSLSRHPQERPAPPRSRPRWRLHAPPAVAAQSPRSNHLIPFPLGGAARLLPGTPRARGAPAVLLPSSPRRPARGPGNPRSPALDNALVKTAELFLTSPPPLLIKAPP